MHRVSIGEDSDDTVDDLDGAEDSLSDRWEEEVPKEEQDIFPRLFAVAVIQHALVARRRLIFHPLGSTVQEILYKQVDLQIWRRLGRICASNFGPFRESQKKTPIATYLNTRQDGRPEDFLECTMPRLRRASLRLLWMGRLCSVSGYSR
ncbi:hypothetical protein GOP47_0011790 [Adiantum capillus-veneris]|uniref:Uncharacterized protein n=1 Tax=Adiantum capillus-veneris TaxID=13818 RepID=A0A9D4ZH36_ADICA|nr:hypothetical protein GOP47_0011790 [Adiantum capillus-veneris]